MNLLKYFFSDEFVIDEKPVPVYTDKTEQENAGGNSKDLLHQISKLVFEKENLLLKMQELQHWTRSSDELFLFIRSFIPFLDAFDRVLDNAREFPMTNELKNWLKSVESLYFRLINVLESSGLQPLKTIGKVVDLNFHDVVEHRKSYDHPNNIVIQERQKGYVFRGRLVRDAKVVVSYNERSQQ